MPRTFYPSLEVVSNGTVGEVSLRERLLGLSASLGVQLLLIATAAGTILLWMGTPPSWLLLSGDALRTGHWWTLVSYVFANGHGLLLLYMVLLLAAATPAVRTTSVRENLRNSGRIVLTVLLCGLAAAAAFILVDGARAEPLEGLLPAILGLIAYRVVRGREQVQDHVRRRLATGRDGALLLAVFVGMILPVSDIDPWLRQWPRIAALVEQAPWLNGIVLLGLAVLIIGIWPRGANWLFAGAVLFWFVVRWPAVADWLTNGPTPWEALLAGIVTGALLGLFAPKLLPQEAAPESA